MSTILIAAYGSRGDVMPLTDVGRRLRDAGHRVVLTSNDELDEEVEACGVEARRISFEVQGDLDSGADAVKLAMQVARPAGIRRLGNTFLDVVEDVDADAVLLTPFTELPGLAFAEARDIPSMGLRLQPLSATVAHLPSLFGARSAGGALNRAVGKTAAAAVDRLYGGAVSDFRRRLGLPRRSAAALRRRRTAEDWPILHGYSPSVLPRPADWRPGLDVVGYWWPRHDETWTPPQSLVEFIDGGAAPVAIGFGSLMVPEVERERISQTVREAVVAAGVRAVVQSGGAGLRVPDDEHTMTVDTVPHEWLFERAAAVVHSCGAGTTAAGLRAARPAVGVPSSGGDQPFWARRLEALGVSAATIPRPKLDVGGLAEAITAAVTTPELARNAAGVAAGMSADDGAGRVVRQVERLLER
ncbi:glycosyltransferase [Tsukamurella sp. 1534]|uniref:glycosyltransferase n=1 Tax=Tsukamurella sp. 1534 TaxID=1151061 RepID=UPI000313480B|nr:glycosyltransferase [Tsukamurella sp. 1534]